MNVVYKSVQEIMISFKIIFGVFIFLMIPLIVSANITVDAYCQLSIQCMQQEVINFQELIALVNQYQDDRETLNQQEELKKVEFAQARDTLFSSYGITNTEYGTYMGYNSQAVIKYLEDNPEIKQQIDELSAQANSLMEQYETLKGVEEEIPAEPSMD
ncbi:hypothetical protein [Desulfosarcina ovata]|uniref:Uncharacterized protein n=1 Tax=Desulfosarcina ovata subsp. ovata TaxID=2752305 RepID=A0A5K8A5A3_9BACT|nr:hypothetical protein [Desulfosarcina ovata]BBO87538.1 hypothetical protein DSCOOX_07180 [Desulfosarcina ovata subsp. ovata]